MSAFQLTYYLDKYITGTITNEEWMMLQQLLKEPGNENSLDELLDKELLMIVENGDRDMHLIARVQAAVNQQIAAEAQGRILDISQKVVHRVHFLRTAWFRYAAAIIILFGVGAYLWNIQEKDKPLITESKPVPVKNDVAPGSNRAVLTLSDGRKVELTPETGMIAETGINIENANGRLEYGKADKVVFNTMSTPRGGQYQLTLPDGTNVWLNAASSITYPTAFVNDIREVSITGEAYFEVIKNAAKPFIVKTSKENITVLGTSFNVNAYPDEAAMKTSLLEGSVKIGKVVLQPGQALLNDKVVSTNAEQDIAWKNGIFNFNRVTLPEAMRQLARWYDVEVKISKEVEHIELGGEIGRDLTLADVLSGLEDKGLHFSLENRILTVAK